MLLKNLLLQLFSPYAKKIGVLKKTWTLFLALYFLPHTPVHAESLQPITVDHFKESIQSGTSVVFFYADTCIHCQCLAPILDDLAFDMKDLLVFRKLNVGELDDTYSSHCLARIPTLILYIDGQEVTRLLGFHQYDKIRKWIAVAMELSRSPFN